ncbi:autotransporter-associated beta strand repeat-containing protein [Methyloligella sp. 2.7D]|uniref:autotransporter-associated beta strand repeat-containing protein n=1 Tax=unclassified Methyloligella TaxID=2625955 RepID=UPI00157BF7E1|nr:autotransporter-associated beta strand repeat-containing protein [Methyloligella sp. GL2]QKP76534.1 autotransporter-associated beta strand repeat-containing protein [Methyloligella sp. GL2]
MADITWGGGSGDFNDDANWVGGTAPGTGDVAVFVAGTAGSFTVDITANVSFDGWRNEGGTFSLENDSDSTVYFYEGIEVTGGSATYRNYDGGTTTFTGNGTYVGDVHITNIGEMNFTNNAAAGSAEIFNATVTGELNFYDSFLAGATVINHGFLDLYSGSTAGTSDITVASTGEMVFHTGTTADQAEIANRGDLYFNDGSTARFATITTNNGGTTVFASGADGESAILIAEAGGVVDFTAAPDAGHWTAGSIAGAGTYQIGANEFRVGSNNSSTEVSGVIEGTDGQLVKTGTGTLTLSGTNTYSGITRIAEGSLQVDGSISASAGITVQDGGTLGGSGMAVTTGQVIVQDGGTIDAGPSGAPSTGVLQTGALQFQDGSMFHADIDGTNAGTGYDQVAVTGQVFLDGEAELDFAITYSVSVNDTYVLIDNDGAEAVHGTFKGLAEGDEIASDGWLLDITYAGGDGNDVTLTLLGASITGTDGDDIVDGSTAPVGENPATSGRDEIFGLRGDDTLLGLAGDDTLDGGQGVDTLNGGAGDDIFQIKGAQGLHDDMDGGADTDTIEVLGNGAVKLDGFKAHVASIEAWDGNGKSVKGTGAKDVFDFSGLSSVKHLDFIDGRGGNDRIVGSDSRDDLRGSVGIDTLIGGAQRDVLSGGKQGDKLTGGAARDLFDFDKLNESRFGKHRDKITDFGHGNDDIDLRGIDAKSGGGNQKFKWIGQQDFSGQKGELHYVKKGHHVLVEGDVNGNGHANFQILVLNHGALHKGDFLL